MKVNSIFDILSLIIISQSVLASKENIRKISQVESWMSTENFTMMIKKSFFYSTCCNIFLSESIHNVEVLFRQFINIYPYEYLLRQKMYDCQSYFLLGPTDDEIEKDMQKIPSSIATTEILIIVNGELKNNSRLFNVSLYGNANANIVSRSGIWTLSKNYLEARVFLNVNSYEDLMSEFSIINLRGRELQVCTFFQPPVSYLNKTTKKIIKGIEEEVFLADNDVEKDGIEMKIFLLIAEKLNFTWTLRKPQGTYRYGRRINNTYWRGGVIQLLREKKIDLAFGSIWLTPNHSNFVNMSEPWYQMFMHFLVPRPQPITNFWALTRPFPIECWLLLIMLLLVMSMYMCARARIDPKFPKRFRSIFFTITELIGRLLGTWVPRNTANARFELHLWQTAGVVLVTAYCSSLAARLASSEYENRIDTVYQFLEANLTWGRKGPEPNYYDYFDMDDPYSSQLPTRYVSIKDDEMTHRFIKKGNFAIIGKIVGSIFFPEDNISNEDLKGYRIMKQMIGNYYSSFAVQPWLLRPVDTIISWLRESGIIYFHLGDVIRRRANFNLREVLKEYDNLDKSARVLGLTPLGAGFTALIVGFLASTIVFFYELKQAAGSRSIREVFREIQKKREGYELSAYKRKCRKEIELMKYSSSNKSFDLSVIKSAEYIVNTESLQISK
ncbi:glutamate receptor 3.4-like [Formica exsecta]|uniref:glutamate receptor 3.4-like n=1 Tax=Formica exsecta TaxID=72781 RepID=UPI001142FFD1|nr:glutamate receptor 3.4-like [Formica exsecta]